MDVEKLLVDAISIMNDAGATWAVIGGCARNAHAEPRATRDVDFVVEADPLRFADLERRLRASGFARASAVTEPGEAVPDLALYRDAAGRRIDLLFAHTAFERSVLSRCAVLAPFGGVAARVASIEDLIVYKLIADRPQDRADIAAVVAAQRLRGTPIDWPYIAAWCDAWEVQERLRALRAELGC